MADAWGSKALRWKVSFLRVGEFTVATSCCRSERSAFGLSVDAPVPSLAVDAVAGQGQVRYGCRSHRLRSEAVLRGGETLTQFIEEAVVAAAAWRRIQSEFVTRGEAAIKRWKQEGAAVR